MRTRTNYLFNAVFLVVLALIMAGIGIFSNFNFGFPMSGPIVGLVLGGILLLIAFLNYNIYKSDKNRETSKDARIEALEDEIRRLKNK